MLRTVLIHSRTADETDVPTDRSNIEKRDGRNDLCRYQLKAGKLD